MGELVFVGLGLHDEMDITLKGLEAARAADVVFAEFYTSSLRDTTPETLAKLLGRPVRGLRREEVERGTEVLEAAKRQRVVLLVPGDPMVATTHVDLRLRAHVDGIPTRIVHGPSIASAAPGILGLQSSKFGRATTVPFASGAYRPTSPLEVIVENRKRGLHTLVLLDVQEGGAVLPARDALRYLLDLAREGPSKDFGESSLVCVLSAVGSAAPTATAGRAGDLAGRDLGPAPQCILVPGELHFMERDALIAFAGAPRDL